MADDIKIGLDGKPLTDAAKPALDALKQLRLAAEALDKADFSRVKKSSQELAGSLKGLTAAAESEMKKFTDLVGASVEKAGAAAKGKAKAAGKALGKQIADALEEEASRARVRISAPSMKLPNGLGASVSGKGVDSAGDVMAEARRLMTENGARTTAQIAAESRARAELAKMETDSSKLTFAARQSAYRWEQGASKAISAEQAAAGKLAQADSNLNYRMRSVYARAEQAELRKSSSLEAADAQRTFSFRSNFYKAEQAEVKRNAASEQADATRTFAFRNNFYKSEAADLARNAKQEATDSALNFRMRSNYIKAESAQMAAAAKERTTVAGMTGRAQVTQAMQNPAGAFSISRGQNTGRVVELAKEAEAERVVIQGVSAAARAKTEAAVAARALSAESKALAASNYEVHSAMRGVAGAGGALFLTYGSLIPLATAFLATTAIIESIKAYKDLEYQIKFVKALAEDGGVGGPSEASMRKQIVSISGDQGFDPVEASKGMRLLAQSGLSAQEALKALPTVLQVAKVGELSVAEATETLTGAVHGFGLQMSDMGHIGDVMAKAGAISNTSVSKISESMKQASTVAQQYGVSLEDVSTILVALAKRNITGSAAGTATANLFRELGTPHGKDAKQISKDLGISLWDPLDKSRKDFFERFVPELRKNLEVLDPQSQNFVLEKLTNNRGAKALGSILGLDDTSLAEVKRTLTDATGFTSQANAKLLDSVEGDMQRLKAAYTGALSEAGSTGAGGFRAILQELTLILGSPEFQSGLSSLVSRTVSFARAAIGAAESAAEFYGWISKMSGLDLVTSSIGWLVDKMKDWSGANSAIAQGDAYIKSLDNQILKVRQLAAEKARADGTSSVGGLDNLRAVRDAAEVEFKKAESARDAITSAQALGKPAFALNEGNEYAKRRLARDQAQAKLMEGNNKNIQLIKEQREFDESIPKSAPLPGNALGTGNVNYTIPDKSGAGAARRAANEDYKNEKKRIDLLLAGNKMLADAADAEEKREADIAQQSYDRGVDSFKTYQQKLSAIQNEQFVVRTVLAESERDIVKRGLEELTKKAAVKKATGTPDVGDALANEVTAMTQQYLKAEQKVAVLVNDQKKAQEKALTAALKPASDILKSSEVDGAKDEQKLKAELEKLRIKGDGLALSDREQAIQGETLRILGAQEEKIVHYQSILKKMTDDGAFADIFNNPETLAVFNRVDGIIAKLQGGVAEAKPQIAATVGGAYDNKRWESYGTKISSSVESSIKDGLTGALTGDMTSLANFGKTLQKTVVGALVDAFYEAFVQDAVKDLGRSIASTLKSAIGVAGGSGGGSVGSLLGAVGGLFGGGSYASAAGVGGSTFSASADVMALAGYDKGGFTGTGSDSDVAGFVHANEFVINAENTSKFPKSFLDSLNGYADGGMVQSLSGPSLSSPAGRIADSGGSSLVFAPVTSISVDSRSDRAAVLQDVQRVVTENQKQYTESLKRMKVIPA